MNWPFWLLTVNWCKNRKKLVLNLFPIPMKNSVLLIVKIVLNVVSYFVLKWLIFVGLFSKWSLISSKTTFYPTLPYRWVKCINKNSLTRKIPDRYWKKCKETQLRQQQYAENKLEKSCDFKQTTTANNLESKPKAQWKQQLKI